MMSPSCRVCGSGTDHVMQTTVRNEHEVDYFRCSRCEYLQTEAPDRLDETPPEFPSRLDTGRLERCLRLARTVSTLLLCLYDRRDRCLDYGGGHGLFVRRMRDLGFDFWLYDPHARNLFARGFAHEPNRTGDYRLTTLLEVLEHVREPLELIRDGLAETRESNLLLGTRLYGAAVPDPDWWYYMLPTGEHIGFLNRTTLRHLAERLGLYLHTDGRSLHLLTERKLPGWAVRLCLRHGGRVFPLLRPWMDSRTHSDLRDRREAVSGDEDR